MRKAILIALVSGLSMLIGGLKVAAAVYSNASVAGTWVCAGNGFHQGKTKKAPSSGFRIFLWDGIRWTVRASSLLSGRQTTQRGCPAVTRLGKVPIVTR